jgi:predicted lipoprotein with Yx(FWY)xxD motif
MSRHLSILTLVPVVVALAACGSSSSGGSSGSSGASAKPSVLNVASKARVGSVLVDAQGRTLYRYTPDHGGKSTCTGGCAAAWPPATVSGSRPLAATGVKGAVTTTTRANGVKQLAFDGMPLYRFSADSATSDAKGQGAEHTWFVIPAKGGTNGSPATTTTTRSRGGYGY